MKATQVSKENGVIVILLEQVIDSLIPEDVMSVIVLDDFSWCFALTESVYRKLASVSEISLVYSIAPLFW